MQTLSNKDFDIYVMIQTTRQTQAKIGHTFSAEDRRQSVEMGTQLAISMHPHSYPSV
jgi:hypothetical protein